MREEREGEEEVDFKELRRLIEELRIKIWQLYSRWRERKRKGLMIEKSKEYFLKNCTIRGLTAATRGHFPIY